MNINLRFGLWKLDTKGKYYHICENQLIWELTWLLLLLLFKMIPWSVLISLKIKNWVISLKSCKELELAVLVKEREREPHNTGIYHDTRVGAHSPKAMAGLNFAWVLKYF
jgi:hypothetical protein